MMSPLEVASMMSPVMPSTLSPITHLSGLTSSCYFPMPTPCDATLLVSPISDCFHLQEDTSISLMNEPAAHLLTRCNPHSSQCFRHAKATVDIISHPHVNAMMMSVLKFFAPPPTSALRKWPGPKPHFQYDLGVLAFEVLYR